MWRVRARLPERKGQVCRLIRTGALNSALVEFYRDGVRHITSRYYIRRIPRLVEP